MDNQDKRALEMIQAIKSSTWSTWSALWPAAASNLSLMHAICALGSGCPGYTNQLAEIATTLYRSLPREQIRREVARPSMEDIAPSLIGFGTSF